MYLASINVANDLSEDVGLVLRQTNSGLGTAWGYCATRNYTNLPSWGFHKTFASVERFHYSSIKLNYSFIQFYIIQKKIEKIFDYKTEIPQFLQTAVTPANNPSDLLAKYPSTHLTFFYTLDQEWLARGILEEVFLILISNTAKNGLSTDGTNGNGRQNALIS